MHKRLFLKYYGVCAIIISITVAVLGIVSSFVLGAKTFHDQSELMERAANKVASTVARMPKNYHILAGNIFDGSINAIKETSESDIIVLDEHGNIQITTFGPGELDMQNMPGFSVITDVLSGNIYRSTKAYGSKHIRAGYTIGVPVISSDNHISGAVFLTTHEFNMQSVVIGTLLIFTACGIIVLIIACVVLFFLTKRLTKPVYEMSDIANSYAKGDFSKRLDVSKCYEYAALASAFNSMADGIDNLEQMRRGFVTDVSHELRTPMTTITGFVDGMLDGTIPEEMHEKYLKIVSEETHRVSRMVTSFLDIAKMQSGQMTYVKKPFDIVENAGKALFAFEDRIEQGNINLKADFESDSIIVNGDEDAIYRVIYNLLDNAIKFTPSDGEIVVTVKTDGDKARVTIRNTGQGISKADAAHIFERFYKADKSRSDNKKGAGIGLYLVKNIIKEHGEDVILTSKEGEFAQFAFTLPLYKD